MTRPRRRAVRVASKPQQKAVRKTSAIIGTTIVFGALGIAVIVASIVQTGGMVTFSWTTMVMPLIGLFLVVVTFWQLRELPRARELDRDGILCEGVLIGKWTDSGDESRNYYVAYQYGDNFQAKQRVSQSLFRQLGPLETVQVRYLQRDPSISRMVVD